MPPRADAEKEPRPEINLSSLDAEEGAEPRGGVGEAEVAPASENAGSLRH